MQPFVSEMTKAAITRSGGDGQPDRTTATHAFLDGSNRGMGLQRGGNCGWMCVPSDAELERMQRAAAESIDNGSPIFLSENAVASSEQEVRRAFCDFDVLTIREKDVDWLLRAARIWQEAVRGCYPEAPAHMFDMLVLMRKTSEKWVKASGGHAARAGIRAGASQVLRFKTGLHCIMPRMYVTEEHLDVFRDIALPLLDTGLPREQGDDTWEKMLDPKYDALRTLGSHKASHCRACKNHRQDVAWCHDCHGRGMVIDTNAVYHLEFILDGEGRPKVDLMESMRDKTLAQLKLSSIRAPRAAEETPGFVCPTDVDDPEVRKRAREEGGSGAGKRKGKGKEELLPQTSHLFSQLEEQVRLIAPEYADVRLQRVQVIRNRLQNIMMYNMFPWDAVRLPCMNNGGKAHNRVGVYFTVHRKNGMLGQRCNCKCLKGRDHGRIEGFCKDVISYGRYHVKLSPSWCLQFFEYPPKQRAQLLEAAHRETAMYAEDGEARTVAHALNISALRIFGTPFLAFGHANLAAQAAAAHTYVHMRRGGTVMSMSARREEVERAQLRIQELRRAQIALLEQSMREQRRGRSSAGAGAGRSDAEILAEQRILSKEINRQRGIAGDPDFVASDASSTGEGSMGGSRSGGGRGRADSMSGLGGWSSGPTTWEDESGQRRGRLPQPPLNMVMPPRPDIVLTDAEKEAAQRAGVLVS